MKRFFRCLMLSLPCALAACAPLQWPGEPASHQVKVNGDVFIIRQLTESTWTATSSGRLKPLDDSSSSTVILRDAVESISGCTVTDSDFSHQGKQFDAQVECDGALSN